MSFQGKNFPKKSDVISFFDHDYLLHENPLNDYFLIRDPFNNTYNPGKTFKLSKPVQVKRIQEALKNAKE